MVSEIARDVYVLHGRTDVASQSKARKGPKRGKLLSPVPTVRCAQLMVTKESRAHMVDTSKILSHPLTIATATALFSLVLVPLFTERWQDHQRELDIKAKLITEMTSVMAEPIADSRIRSRGASVGPEMPSYSQTLRNIDVKQAEISALLEIYFPDQPELSRDWDAFARALNYCVRLTAADLPDRKIPHLDVVRGYVEQSHVPLNINWQVLGNAKWNEGFGPDFEQAYESLTQWMLQQGNRIVQRVLASKVRLAGSWRKVDIRNSRQVGLSRADSAAWS
jgi:hypothetical protein